MSRAVYIYRSGNELSSGIRERLAGTGGIQDLVEDLEEYIH